MHMLSNTMQRTGNRLTCYNTLRLSPDKTHEEQQALIERCLKWSALCVSALEHNNVSLYCACNNKKNLELNSASHFARASEKSETLQGCYDDSRLSLLVLQLSFG